MATFIRSRYVPIDTAVIMEENESRMSYYSNEGYECKKGPNNLHLLKKEPVLEVFLKEEEKILKFNMIKDARKYYKKHSISEKNAYEFAIKISSGEIEVSIFPDGTYALKYV